MLDVDIGFQGVEEEIATLSGKYAAPDDAFLLARSDAGIIIGGIGVRPFPRSSDHGPRPAARELKRLFVHDEGRGSGAGRALAEAAVAVATGAGYREIVLDSLPSMTAAIGLHHSIGFTRIASLYFGLALG